MNRRQLLRLIGIVSVILLGAKLGAKPQADPQVRSMTISTGTLTTNDIVYRVKPELMKGTTWKLR